MPWVEVEKGHHEVETDGRAGADDQVGEEIVAHLQVVGFFELFDDDEDGAECRVCHYYAVDEHGAEEHLLRSLWTIAHGENELHGDEEDACVSKDVEDVFAEIDLATSRVECRIGERASDEVKGEVEVAERKPGEQ